MLGWGQEAWGHDPWGNGTPAPPTPTPQPGDGHIPLVFHLAETGSISGAETAQIEIQPILRVDDLGAVSVRFSVTGELFNLDAGKTVTVRIRTTADVSSALSSGTIITTLTLSANGLFSVTGGVVVAPSQPLEYILTYQTDDAVAPSPLIRSMLVIAEVF